MGVFAALFYLEACVITTRLIHLLPPSVPPFMRPPIILYEKPEPPVVYYDWEEVEI